MRVRVSPSAPNSKNNSLYGLFFYVYTHLLKYTQTQSHQGFQADKELFQTAFVIYTNLHLSY
ncbi:hypothetical protein [Neisseria dumasiana]|uniref:hypothetical protein n=1 Tax=Neisseria dumasiana TaxID=1931275 RepID=UPI000F7A709E|nr:hypothetical protein [Neisseria dumasiana]